MEKLIEKYALENAVRHGGKANPGAIIGSVIQEDPDAKSKVQELQKLVGPIVKKINSMSPDEQKEALLKLDPSLLEKKKAKEKGLFDSFKTSVKVVTAFPPEPSKYPHIGHAKALFVNYSYAKENKGKFILRFEDTNPTLAKKEFYDIILENFKWLGVIPDEVDYASNHMDEFYKHAETLINLGKAYVCFCSQERVSESRMKSLPCDCRYQHIKENLIAWEKMPSMPAGKAILRLKIDLKHRNSTMRDPTIFRIIKKPHVRLKRKYTVWPNYDFENSVMDGLEGVTHRFRSKEFEMRNALQRYIQKLLGFKETDIFEFARFNLEGVVSSGRVIREMIEKKELTGWDDPSLTTIVALRRRGFLPKAIKDFVLNTGINKSEATLSWGDLIMHNKRILDPECNRYFFINEPVTVKIRKSPEQKINLKLHPDFPRRGLRPFRTYMDFYLSKDDYDDLKENNLFRLMDCLNFIKKEGKFYFDSLEYEKFRFSGTKIIHWLPIQKNLVSVKILMPDKKVLTGLAEPLVSKLRIGDTIQFERVGFCKLDSKKKGKLVFWLTH
jgi:glutamyl-tRNA synthetase